MRCLPSCQRFHSSRVLLESAVIADTTYVSATKLESGIEMATSRVSAGKVFTRPIVCPRVKSSARVHTRRISVGNGQTRHPLPPPLTRIVAPLAARRPLPRELGRVPVVSAAGRRRPRAPPPHDAAAAQMHYRCV
jgi:hypothetical protein